MKINIKQSLENRHFYYALEDNSNLTTEQIENIVHDATAHLSYPLANDSQSVRMVLLPGLYHYRLWEVTKNMLKAIISAELYSSVEKRIDYIFADSNGTVLFYEDQGNVRDSQKISSFAASENSVFSERTPVMYRLALWLMFEHEGMDASLQPYSPLIDEVVRKKFHLPTGWKLITQMPLFVSLEQNRLMA